MKKVFTLILIATLGFLAASCNKEIKSDIDVLQSNVATIEQQISSINSSITSLESFKSTIDSKVSALEQETAALEKAAAALEQDSAANKAEIEANKAAIAALKEQSEQLGEDIEELKEYVEDLNAGTRTWAEATFATLQQMSAIETRLATIEAFLPTVDTKISEAIAALETSIKSWVGAQLADYSKTADMEARVAKAEAAAKEADDALKAELEKEIKAVSDSLSTLKSQFDDKVKALIDEAVAEGGVINNEIAAQVKAAKDELDAKITALDERVTALEIKVEALEDAFAEMLSRVQSITVVPDYIDGRVDVPGEVRFEILPIEAAEALVANSEAFSFQAVEVATKAGESSFKDFTIESVEMDEAGEFVVVTVAIPEDADWTEGFKNGSLNLSARLKIEANEDAGDYVCRTSNYFSLKTPITLTVSKNNVGDNSFTWKEGDKVLVTVGGESAEFTLVSGAGDAVGTFEGELPGSGRTFDIQYPTTAPDITNQTYVADALADDIMLFTKTDCPFGTSVALEPQYAVIQLNLYGTDKTVGKVEVKVGTNTFYKLDCGYSTASGVAIGATEETATPFYVVVPAGEYAFTAIAYDNLFTPGVIGEFTTSGAKTLAAAECLNMPAKECDVDYPYVDLGLPSGLKWSTYNVGATAPDEHGQYFAWGGVTQRNYNTYIWKYYEHATEGNSMTWNYNIKVTKYSTDDGYAVSGTADGKTILEPADDAATYNWGGSWRMGTQQEGIELGDNVTVTYYPLGSVINGHTLIENGLLLTSTVEGYEDKSIFFSFAACVATDSYWNPSTSWPTYGQSQARYWLSYGCNDSGSRFLFTSSSQEFNSTAWRYQGYSVRGVRAAQ